MAKTALGRGFDTLIPKDLDSSLLSADKNRVQNLLTADIVANPKQPRGEVDPAALAELTASVKRHGVLQPIIVVRVGNKYQIVAGERRWRAAQAAALESIPVIVRSLAELEQLELSIIENIQRVDLSPLDQALSIYRLNQEFNLTFEQIAERLGKATSTVSNIIRLLNLPEAARLALQEGKITEGHARAILALKGQPIKQAELLELIIKNSWTVRQAEQFVVGSRSGDSQAAKARADTENEHTKRLSKHLGTPIKVKYTASGGQVIIHFKDDAHLAKLTQQITSKL